MAKLFNVSFDSVPTDSNFFSVRIPLIALNSHSNLALAMHALCAQSTQCHQTKTLMIMTMINYTHISFDVYDALLLQQPQHESTYFCYDDLLSMNAQYRIHHPAATATTVCSNETVRRFHLVRSGQPRW